MSREKFKPGDYVYYFYGMPFDSDTLQILTVDGDYVTGFSEVLKTELTQCPISQLVKIPKNLEEYYKQIFPPISP